MFKVRQLLGKYYLISSAILSARQLPIGKPSSMATTGHGSAATLPPLTTTMISADQFSLAYVTAPDDTVAKQIASKLVADQLAACVNIVPGITSVYRWKGNVETDSEVMMIIKTRTDRINELTELVKANHPYEVFELISVPIQNGNPDYLKWLDESIPKKIATN
ncbi:protein CutA homolog [Oppia nitens]|uniref:protein CutA homolog n=1 Tax=Oppia nitens TaxID=1686743 RepID=UPI0023DAA552|nr:protein CutA homolog [Oppia nitens]